MAQRLLRLPDDLDSRLVDASTAMGTSAAAFTRAALEAAITRVDNHRLSLAGVLTGKHGKRER